MIKKIGFFITLSILAVASFANNLLATPIPIVLNPAKGTKTTYVIATNSTSTISMMGQDMNIVLNSAYDYTIIAKGDSAGLTSFQAVLNSVKIVTEQMGMSIAINTDSIKPGSGDSTIESMSRLIKRITKQPFTVYIGKTGKIEATSGAKEIFHNAFSNSDLTGPLSALKGTVNESMLTSNLDQLFSFLPGKAVDINEKWLKNDTINTSGMQIACSASYKLDKLGDGVASVAVNSALHFDGPLDAAPGATIKALGIITGTYKINVATGMLDSFSGDTNLEMKMSIKGMDMPMKSIAKSTITTK